MANLLRETVDVLEKYGKTVEDIEWIGSGDGYIALEVFVKLANVHYDAGYGTVEIAEDLLIVGEDWWLERGEYDGSEWWEFKTVPTKPNNQLYPIRLDRGIWTNLKQMESEDNYDDF